MAMIDEETLYKIIFSVRGEVIELKRKVERLEKRLDDMDRVPDTLVDPPATFDIVERAEPETLNLEYSTRVLIEKAMKRNNGNRRKAAQDLGISDRTLYRRLKQFGIE